MFRFCRALLSFAFACGFVLGGYSQVQDKEQSRAMVELAAEMLKASQAEDDVRDIMVQAADLDTTSISANFEAGRLHLLTIKKEQAVKYLQRIYRQKPNYRFDLEYYIGLSYQYGLQFDKAIDFYNRYKARYQRQPNYQGRDKVSLKEIDRKLYECNNGKEYVSNPKPFVIVNIGPQINSEANDYAPVLNEKEDEIIFTSRRLDGNLNENVFSDNKPYEDIFISNKVNGKWTRAANIGRTVNIPNHNSNVALSPDGKTLFSYRDENGGDIFVSELRPDNSWSSPKPLPGIINSPYMESSVSITRDGNTLFFASERPGGQGGIDIYSCVRDNRGNWSKVRNLGPTINTERHEDGPFIDYSGKKLYFSSQSHKGMGGYDIFESDVIDAGSNTWTEPLNVGYPINTPDNDIYFVGTADNKRGYYASVRDDGLGYLDVYMIGPKELVKKSNVVLPVKLVVKVIDAKTNTPLEANIELLSISDSKPVTIAAKAKGNYTFSVVTKDPKNYRLSVKHDGYFPQTEEITLQSADVVEKTVTRTVGMAVSEKAPVIIPLKYTVKVVDAKTNLAIDASVKLESTPDNTSILPAPKGAGAFEFSVISPVAKTYKLTVEKTGYTAQTEQINLEGAGITEKNIAKTVSLISKEPVIVALRYVVMLVDAKTNLPIDATVKLTTLPENTVVSRVTKGGTTEFPLTSTTIKDYQLSVEREGYVSQNQTVKIEGATSVERIVSKTVGLAAVIVPLKFTVKVVDEKTNLPLDASLKLESAGDALKSGATAKATGTFDFAITTPTSKEYSLTAEREGYVLKNEKFTVEGAGTAAKTITRTIVLAEVKKEPVIVPLKFTVKVVDEKTNLPLDANLKLESTGDALKSGATTKATGTFDFTIATPTSKEYSLTAEREGYVLKNEKFTVEGAGTAAKTVSRTITLAEVKKEPVIVPLKFTVKVVDEKTNLPLDASLKLESTGDALKSGATTKATGTFDFTIATPTSKEYSLTAEREGYVLKNEKFTVEGAGTAAKTITRTITLAEVKKEPVIVPLKFTVKVVDEKTNLPLDASLKLESTGDALKSGATTKATGTFDFTIATPTSKEYSLTAEREGYVLKNEKFTVEGAGTAAKTITRTITLAEVKKEPVIVPLKFTVKVVDEKTNLPLDASLKLESAGDALKSGATTKATGTFDFTIATPTSKEYSLTAEREGYVLKNEKFTVEGAGTAAKTVSRTITLAEVKKEPVIVPLKFTVKVVDEKTNLPLDASLKLESAGDALKSGATTKATGTFDFTIATPTSKEYSLTAEREGYVLKNEKFTVEGAGTAAKTVSRTITLAEVKKEPVIVPLKFTVKVVDEKTNLPLDASLKLESAGDALKSGATTKATGTFDFTIATPTSKEYSLTAEREGYVLKNEKFTVEGAGTAAKTITRTIVLAEVKKEPVIVPLKFTVKVVDEKTNLPLDANLKLESAGDALKSGATTKATGTYDFTIATPTSKEYSLTAEREGYVLKNEKFTVEGAGTAAKTISRTITLAEVKKEPVIVPLKFTVKVVDEKTNLPLDANLKLESAGDALKSGATTKATGTFDFTIATPTSKEYSLTAEREGYVLKNEKFTVEGAGTAAKTITRTITLAEVRKEPVIVPLKFTVKVVDEKTNLPLDANLKLESAGDALKSGATTKATGTFDFTIATPTSKEYSLTAEREGYTLKNEKFTVEGAGTAAKTITRTITLKSIPIATTVSNVAVKLVVTTVDKKTNLPIEANVILQGSTDNKKVEGNSKGSGVYEFNVNTPAAKDYKISADREGYVYLAQQIRIEAATDKEKTLTRTLSLQPIAVGATSVLRNLFFDVGKASIRPESLPELSGFENMMKQNPSVRVEISGHTDNVGDNAFNKNLSQLRANAVKTFLTSKGVDPKRIVAIGFGETKPLVSNDDEEGGREINRRVELKVLSK